MQTWLVYIFWLYNIGCNCFIDLYELTHRILGITLFIQFQFLPVVLFIVLIIFIAFDNCHVLFFLGICSPCAWVLALSVFVTKLMTRLPIFTNPWCWWPLLETSSISIWYILTISWSHLFSQAFWLTYNSTLMIWYAFVKYVFFVGFHLLWKNTKYTPHWWWSKPALKQPSCLETDWQIFYCNCSLYLSLILFDNIFKDLLYLVWLWVLLTRQLSNILCKNMMFLCKCILIVVPSMIKTCSHAEPHRLEYLPNYPAIHHWFCSLNFHFVCIWVCHGESTEKLIQMSYKNKSCVQCKFGQYGLQDTLSVASALTVMPSCASQGIPRNPCVWISVPPCSCWKMTSGAHVRHVPLILLLPLSLHVLNTLSSSIPMLS